MQGQRERERKQLPVSNQSTGGNGEEFVNTIPCTCTCMGGFVHRGEVDIIALLWIPNFSSC